MRVGHLPNPRAWPRNDLDTGNLTSVVAGDADLQDDESEENLVLLPDYELPRPSYYTLQLLGMWQPSNVNIFKGIYQNVLLTVIWIFCLAAVFGRCFLIDFSEFRGGRLLNAISQMLSLCAPFILAKIYFQNGHYRQEISRLATKDRETFKSIEKLSKMYSAISLILWSLSFVFFYFHYHADLFSTFFKVCYLVVLFFCNGWWAIWLTVYSFVCSVHKMQIEQFINQMQEKYGYSTRTLAAEENCIRDLIKGFTTVKNSIQRSHKDFEKLISFSVIYTLLDVVIFSVAYWKNDYTEFPLWQYIIGIAFDFLSVLFRLYPAAVVNQSLHDIVRVSGEHCYPDIDQGETPKQRFIFYQFLYLREQDLGMQVLGLKITSKLTVGIFVTIATVALAFLHYVVPFLKHLSL